MRREDVRGEIEEAIVASAAAFAADVVDRLPELVAGHVLPAGTTAEEARRLAQQATVAARRQPMAERVNELLALASGELDAMLEELTGWRVVFECTHGVVPARTCATCHPPTRRADENPPRPPRTRTGSTRSEAARAAWGRRRCRDVR